MSVLFFFLIGAAAISFQTAVADYFYAWTGVVPDGMLLVTLYFGLHRGRETGLVGGFTMGLIQDVLSGGILGVNALSKGLIGHFTGRMKRNVTGREAIMHAVIAFFSSGFNLVLVAGLAAVFLPDQPLSAIYWIAGVKTMLLNTLLAPIVVGLLGRAEARVLPPASGVPYPERS